jgi:hypothetical protein
VGAWAGPAARGPELRTEIDDLAARAEAQRAVFNGLMPTLYDRSWPTP